MEQEDNATYQENRQPNHSVKAVYPLFVAFFEPEP
jgi:hypothetical protein